jgi:catecholate siderophore receptor
MEGEGYTNVGTFNSGKNRVRGVEFTLAGNVTPEWTIQGGVTLMYSKVLASATPANVGKMLSNFAKNSAQFQTKYQFTPKFSMGAAVKYESARYAGQPDTAAAFTTLPTGGFAYSQPVPAYTVGDLFASYDITQTMKLAVNINNITDADYYLAAYRSGSFVYIGDARSVRATLSIDF